MNNFVKILEKMKYLQECKKVLPFETLGRSLAYNCYTPRLNFADLQILKSYQKVTMNLNDIENLLQNSTNIESNVFDFLESNNVDSNNISKNENKVIIFLQDSISQNDIQNDNFIESSKEDSLKFIESNRTNSQDFLESKNLDSVKFIESNPNKNPINIIDSISMLRRLTPYFITFDSIIIDCYQVLEIAIAGADMFIFDYRIFSEFCEILCYLDSKNMSLDSINLSNFNTQNFKQDSKQDFKHAFNQDCQHDFSQKIKNFSQNNELEIANLTSNLASEILNLANNLALIPIFKIHSQSDIESISKIYNIECIICDKKLENLEPYINLNQTKKL
ncbi:hypothetical protein DCO58_06190 [Helicobacter saguini]|uniref:Indole-3-glycerol-phosphate synthase n=1 Tax=Helicobacter saguini TaxID=1548018 RepID=A0A347VTJ5_9HELI|nr:hypothetical protein [Helicobacter saguini]MWV62069.1 hypothetical protein [Helicobacter saguini]MWV67257.1 hypothetical protein [Helicobacter saguini]MWV69611.1 hypothetical protein [Helicobacter saguini]MWV70839.1 hypothetical protein [Helicobacter saguini]TLD94323.1 hypothetical protein LS64_006300 [Helicobacter saguini]